MEHAKLRLVAAALVLASSLAAAQLRSANERLEDAQRTGQTKNPVTIVQPGGVALESPIDPQSYYVGPSDVIAVNIWTSPALSFVLTVTPEGTLIVPTVAEVPVAGITLSKAKTLILAEVRKRYMRTDASVTLVVPRPIIVNVVGNVLNPGLYTMTASDRADRAVALANEVLPGRGVGQVPPPADLVSTRNIRLRHRDGSDDRVDLPLFMYTKENRLNPLLREGDVVVVPQRDPSRNVFAVYGEVNTPGRFEFVQGDRVLDALNIAHGLTGHAHLDSVTFSRLNLDGTALTARIIDIGAILAGSAPNLALEPGDRIVVSANIDLRQDYRVSVVGEVNNPGTYPITKDRTRLSDAIRLAGGLTEFASLGSAELLRRSIGPADVEIENLESARGGIASEDSAYYLLETKLRISKEIVAVDFERLIAKHDTTQDVFLQGEDYIVIPSAKKTVYVFGQVVTNGHIPFMNGEGAAYYIRKAGGFTGRAREGDVKIVKARTRQWLSPKETSIEAGDYVWVPREIERSFGYYMGIIGQTAAIVSVGVSIILLVMQTNK